LFFFGKGFARGAGETIPAAISERSTSMLAHEIKRDALTVRLTGDLDHAGAERIRPELDGLLEDTKIKQLVLISRNSGLWTARASE
jgi:hypothetical protein